MPGTVIGKSLNLGYAGKVSRNVDNIVGARIVKSILGGGGAETQPNIPFGFPVVINTDNTYSKFGASGTGVSAATVANFAGFAVGEVAQVITGYLTQNANGEYAPNTAADVLERGSTTIFVADTTSNAPTANGKVYICLTKGDSAYDVGTIFASATPTDIGTGTVAELTNIRFTTGKVDANGISEITILSRNTP